MSIREHVVAAGRDIIVISTVVSILFGSVIALTKPYWQPFADIPRDMAILQTELAQTRILLEENIEPRILDFQGGGIIVSENHIAGGSFQVMYSLRRNATCETIVTPIFYDLERNISIRDKDVPSVRAPVTNSFEPFSLELPIPSSLRPGRYVYYPILSPVDCGVYGRIRVPPSTIINVAGD